MCVQITVLFDGIAEDTELFTVVLTTNDSSVIFTRGTTSVAIINSDGKGAIMWYFADYAGLDENFYCKNAT